MLKIIQVAAFNL